MGFGVVGLVNALFPRLHNDLSCDDSRPANSAQQSALRDARSRSAAECTTLRVRCKFAIHDQTDGLLRISPFVVETDFLEGCIYKDSSLDTFVYDRNGKFVRTEEAPYGLL